MKAISYSSAGDSSVLQLVDRPAADPGPDEVRVRVVVSGVNPTDWKARTGGYGPLPFPENVPNQDGAGVVDDVGSSVTGLAVGDLGPSFRYGRPAADVLAEAVPHTLLLMGTALVLSFVGGVVVGAWQSSRAGTLADRVTGTVSR